MTAVVLWRHGRTAWNATRRVQGHADVDLDEVGVAQAADAAVRLAALEPTAVVSSDLRRATSTAAPLAELTGLPVKLDSRLRERYFGPWQGLNDVELREQYPKEFADWVNEAIGIPEIETVDDLAKRVLAGLRDAIEEAADGTVVVVTHGGSARAASGALLGWPPAVWRTLAALHNCHRSVLVHSVTRGWQLAAHNLP